jgi:hypothetical protein
MILIFQPTHFSKMRFVAKLGFGRYGWSTRPFMGQLTKRQFVVSAESLTNEGVIPISTRCSVPPGSSFL